MDLLSADDDDDDDDSGGQMKGIMVGSEMGESWFCLCGCGEQPKVLMLIEKSYGN